MTPEKNPGRGIQREAEKGEGLGEGAGSFVVCLRVSSSSTDYQESDVCCRGVRRVICALRFSGLFL